MKAQIQNNLQRILIGGTLLLLGLLIFLFFSLTVAAKEQTREEDKRNHKYFTTVQIQKGDTLWSIAQRHISPEYKNIQAYIEEVKRSNRLEDDTIRTGCYLLIPYYASEPQTSSEEDRLATD